MTFDRRQAFDRTLGWLTNDELDRLGASRVAIAGLGGVGGSELLTLVRLGIGAFNIADPDSFELANFNRQAGATLRTLGRPKCDVLAEMALDINPELDLRRFRGIDAGNIDAFLDGADCFVDGIDFFALDVRARLFAACAERGIPAITAAPIGWGASLLVFRPGGMTFADYFGLDGLPAAEQWPRFLAGLTPEAVQIGALVEARIDPRRGVGPSTPVGCELCAALVATTVAKLLIGRGEVPAAPASLHFDAFTGICRTLERPGAQPHSQLLAALAAIRAAAARGNADAREPT